MARGRRRRKKRRSIWRIIFPVLLIILLVLLGVIAYWVLSGNDDVLPQIPTAEKLTGNTNGAATDWDEQTVASDSGADEIARLKEQYEAGRIDYGGVKKGLARIDAGTLSESDVQSYQDLSAQAEQDLKETVDGYMSGGNYSEAYALLNRMRATLPEDAAVQSLVSQYQAELGL